MANGTVEALYPYTYEAGDGRTIAFATGDRFTLLNKTNGDWWQVKKGSEKPMYVPASYMREIVQRRTDPIYENVENFDNNRPCNGESVTIEENGAESVEEENNSIEESTIQNGDDRLDQQQNEGTANSEENLVDSNGVSSESTGFKSVSSSVKSLAKSLELSGARPGGSFSAPRSTDRPKSQSLPVGWVIITDESSGRPCYYNSKTSETSWKPPRISRSRTPPPNDGWATPPLGWRISRSSSTDELVYVNEYSEEEWMPSKDNEGRVYYYQVNGEASSWELPEVEPATRQSFEALDVTYRRRSPNLSLRNSKCQSLLTSSPRNSQTNLAAAPLTAAAYGFPPPPMFHERSASVQSRESVSSGGEDYNWPAPPTPTTDNVNFFQEIEKQGVLNRKKLLEGGGKKVKKVSWTPTFVILFSANLVFYKDQKASAQKPGLPHGKPESSCVLQGASLEWAPSATTKKKNAFQIRAVSGLVFLLQHDHQMEANNWFSAIAAVIKRLNEEEPLPVAGSVQYQSSQGSDRNEDKRNIRDRLRKLISKRPPIEELEKKGIIKESVFGCHIAHLCERQKTTVPVFVSSCIAAIEKRGLSYDGLYRVCGNVSTVQKLRIMIDQEEKIVLGEPPFDDVHALTGSLKLYFRELPEPLIPYDFFSGFVEAIKQSTRKGKLTAMRSLAVQMPKVNGETLKVLLRHLRKLMDQSEANRMTAQNVAIVWGPNLMWPRYDSGDIAVNMVHQNQIIEFLLLEYDHVFK
ncbi:rho GTPase-activating protein 12-like isoform X2 [Oculina patagonica]